MRLTAHCTNLNDDRPILSAAKCWTMALVSRNIKNIRYMRIFAAVPRGRGVKQNWGGENKLFFSFMSRYLENGTKYDQSYW